MTESPYNDIKAKLIQHQTQRIEFGYTFPLDATSIGLSEVIKIRVRRINTMDKAVVDMLPMDVQQSVWQGMQALNQARLDMEEDEIDSLMDVVRSNEKYLISADKLLVASSIEPRIVATAAEANRDPDAWHIDLIAAEDRLAFFFACADASSGAARKMKAFRPPRAIEGTGVVIEGAGQAAPDAPAGPTESMAPATFSYSESA